ncbi:hypothetical protein [Paraburkholderia tropica]|uniref:Uncharacterized protein n=1 Tax=Paraburkholderia tropica TaxID=92647 RepID=A0AAQ1GJ36_9BURK|nr:hypothetical protein [Paraburkholderia tropica]RQN37380.1 hypothetical protein EHZ25_18635 [Paraburkholderia tropica]SEK02417.1 hypothetical protein SAMN05216550_113170 [Paraburkholderia tropica]
MKDAIYMVRGTDGSLPLSFIDRAIELARSQAEENGLDRVHIWVKPCRGVRADPDSNVVAVMWSSDEIPPKSSFDLEDHAYLGVFTIEPMSAEQKLVAQSGARV